MLLFACFAGKPDICGGRKATPVDSAELGTLQWAFQQQSYVGGAIRLPPKTTATFWVNTPLQSSYVLIQQREK